MFLSLLRFPKPIWFNKEMGTFEIVDNAKKNLLKQLKSLVHAHTPVNPIYNVTIQYPKPEQKITALDLKLETSFTVQCLDREQGVAWIKQERLPAFLNSDCYFEYRLAKLLSQLECNTEPGLLQIDRTYRPWFHEIEDKPVPAIVEKVEVAMKELYICLGKASVTQTKAMFTQAKDNFRKTIVQSARKPIATIMTPAFHSATSLQSSGSSLSDDQSSQHPSGETSTSGHGGEDEGGEEIAPAEHRNPPVAPSGLSSSGDDADFLGFEESEAPGPSSIQQCSAGMESRRPALRRMSQQSHSAQRQADVELDLLEMSRETIGMHHLEEPFSTHQNCRGLLCPAQHSTAARINTAGGEGAHHRASSEEEEEEHQLEDGEVEEQNRTKMSPSTNNTSHISSGSLNTSRAATTTAAFSSMNRCTTEESGSPQGCTVPKAKLLWTRLSNSASRCSDYRARSSQTFVACWNKTCCPEDLADMPLPAAVKVTTTLNFFISGSFHGSAADICRISQYTLGRVSRIIGVCCVLHNRAQQRGFELQEEQGAECRTSSEEEEEEPEVEMTPTAEAILSMEQHTVTIACDMVVLMLEMNSSILAAKTARASCISLLDDILISVEARKLPVRTQTNRQLSNKQYFDDDQELCNPSFSKPKVVDNELFEFVPEYSLQAPATIYVEVKSENETEHNIEEKEKKEDQVSTYDKTTTQITETNLPSTPDETKPHLDHNTKIDTHIASKSSVLKTPQLNPETSSAVSDKIKTQGFSGKMGEESPDSNSSNEEDDIRDSCYVTPRHSYNFKNGKGIEKFKKFLQGTAGEKYWWLWMDIERLKVIKDGKKKQSYLNKIRNRFLFSGGEYHMNAETRARLGLSFISQWTVENLCQIQSDIVTPLLLYWGPRYCINQGFPIRQAGIVLKDWKDRQLRPKSDVSLFSKTNFILPNCVKKDSPPKERGMRAPPPTQLAMLHEDPGEAGQRPKWGPIFSEHFSTQKSGASPPDNVQQKCLPKKHKQKTVHRLAKRTFSPNRELQKKGVTGIMLNTPISRLESKDQLLNSIGSIWSNASQSMTDYEEQDLSRAKEIRSLEKLMRITKYQEAVCNYKMENLLHALHHESKTGYIFTDFCEKTRNPFMFATYIVDGAPADVDVDTENKKSIFQKLEPPFEELFDEVEMHTLILLLVPWMRMIEMDRTTYNKVALIEEIRYLDSIYDKKLQELQRKIFPNEDFPLPIRSADQVQIAEDHKDLNYWQKVPEEFQNYTLDILIHNRLELENFQAFLGENFAGMDLKCWLDIEYFRRIPHNENVNRSDKSKEIKSKYLNQKYFFALNSPATKAQQDEVMMLAGGWGKLLHNQFSSEVLIEVQKYVKARLERKWLPMFLATPEFAARHHARVQLQDVVEDQLFQRSAKKRAILDNKFVSSSKEIIAFRKALLNPVTALQFQHYLSLKGELMENNVIFWLEVQKYKDMYHSHASKESMQNKITAIISCFINSNIPPTLQINIPPEYAYEIINYRQEQGPYIFREAQMAVFEVLFKLWPEFTNFRRSVANESVLPSLERKIMTRKEKNERKGIVESSTEVIFQNYANIRVFRSINWRGSDDITDDSTSTEIFKGAMDRCHLKAMKVEA
uniref:regulator of G-protein signaling 22-like n=1 Tax=Pristiophorus japonicus TaxID=55135 RepID=UPI00398E5859